MLERLETALADAGVRIGELCYDTSAGTIRVKHGRTVTIRGGLVLAALFEVVKQTKKDRPRARKIAEQHPYVDPPHE